MMKHLALVFLFHFVHCEPEGEKISFSSPEMNDEEQFSSHLPKGFECDACTAISFQMVKQLSSAEKSGKRLKESGYLDIFDNVCSGKTWEGYGLKAVEGVNRLSGDGLEANDVPGMMYGGGKWPGRLSGKCFNIVGEHGEDELYSVFRSRNDFKTYLCSELSNDCSNNKKSEL